ncbi:uncharacterized protein LOC119288649 [Triticum dicoccoides]|uniref:uncharacterized protein LOC119288649 n=1 Tax=Triticum dicoccoides TaxID=85692 RepID=UPI00188FBD7B|nr:uncharacterized protein LOC119288649 [Triticum dicoccoides]
MSALENRCRRGRQRRLRWPLLRRHRRPTRPRVPHLQPLRWVPEGDQGDGEQQEWDEHALLHLRQGVIVAADSRASMGGYTWFGLGTMLISEGARLKGSRFSNSLYAYCMLMVSWMRVTNSTCQLQLRKLRKLLS